MDSDLNFPVILFDGVCNLCNVSVQWVLKRDQKGQFRFAALQSGTGQRLLERFGQNRESFDTVVLVDGDRLFTRSDAAIEIARRLGKPWSWLALLRWIPKRLRDAAYDIVARHRYRWFGRRETCMLPRPEWKERFV
ncbi:MAG: thiol-disulfide oxidoreductase DCC family protein [Thermoanaerobaculia bacterium]|nr:thiol-disulfide oxidoreductase DCC family protein [Thermoanaerobaculia bacterium]